MKLLTVDYPQQNVCQLTLTATAQELETAAAAVYERVRPNFTIKGFEKGAANRAEIEADRGEHVFWYDAINDIMDADAPALFEATVEELSLDVVSEVAYDLVSVNKEDGFTATATVCLLPKFEIGDYKSIAVSATPSCVTDVQIQHYIERKQRLNAELVPHKGPAVKGNTVHLSYVGMVDGKVFQGGSAENMELVLGGGKMIPGFEEAILGKCAGDSFDIEVTFPAAYRQKELAGKPAVFKAKLVDACVKEIPALNCDFAKKVGNVDTMEEYQQVVRETLENLRRNNAMNNAKGKVINAFSELVVGDAPEPMVTQAYAAQVEQMQQSLQQQNMTKAQYLQLLKKTDEEFTTEMKEKAERTVRVALGFYHVAKIENLVPTQEELDKIIEERAERAKKPVEELRATVNMRSLAQVTMRKSAMDFLVDHAQITITEPATEPAK